MSACEFGACSNAPRNGRSGLCNPHRQQLQKGQPLHDLNPPITMENGFERRGDCLVWVHAHNDKGYGQLTVNGRVQYTHRLMYEAVRGPIPAGWHVDHLCRNTACAEISHLEAVTHAENIRRGMEHSRVTKTGRYSEAIA